MTRIKTWWSRNIETIWVTLIVVDVIVFHVALPLPESKWRYYLPAVGGWMSLHDKLNSLTTE